MSRDRLRFAGGEALRKVLDHAKKNGWSAEQTPGDHVNLTKDGRQPLFCALTGSMRGALKTISRMRRQDKEAEQGEPA